jgi:Acyltransferase family
MSDRNAALDRARTFITLLVLANHSVVAYTEFGRFYPNHYLWSTAPIVDSQKWIGFNVLTLFNDAFFMALMFFLSGLFVWPSLQRKGIVHFLRDRALRLGLPFLAAILILMPIAYYASFRLTGSKIGFIQFWLQNFKDGIWFDGPAWFVWLLLLFDILAVPLFLAAPKLIDAINRLSTKSYKQPTLFIGALFLAAVVAYVPMLFQFGAVRWFNFGPLQVQASRVLLYGVFFIAGMGAGAVNIDQGLLGRAGNLARHWYVWVLSAAVAFSLLTILINFRRMRLSNLAGAPPLWWQSSYGVIYALACVTISLGALALFLRFAQGEKNLLDPLRADAYGMYIVHYIFCLWLQYALLSAPLPAIAKALIVFVGTVGLSWGTTAAVRRIPGATRIL